MTNRLCRNWATSQKCGGCTFHHGTAGEKVEIFEFKSHLYYDFQKALKAIDGIFYDIDEYDSVNCIVRYLAKNTDVNKEIKEKYKQVVNKVVEDIKASMTSYIEKGYGTTLASYSFDITQPLAKDGSPISLKKNKQNLQYWALKKGCTKIQKISININTQPSLRNQELESRVWKINKNKTSKPVSALEVSCGVKNFAARIVSSHVSVKDFLSAPDIVGSGSTLAQILSWLMGLSYNYQRHLICFEKTDYTSIWAHSLYPGNNQENNTNSKDSSSNDAPTSQSPANMNFSTAVEEYFLNNTKEGEYIYASLPVEFGDFKLLTYFEVDGFLNGETVEIKSQLIGGDKFLAENSANSILNSFIFTVKDHERYLQFTGKREESWNAYSISNGVITDRLHGDRIDNEGPLKKLHAILLKVRSMLATNADLRAVVLQLRPVSQKIEFIEVKTGCDIEDTWRAEIEFNE